MLRQIVLSQPLRTCRFFRHYPRDHDLDLKREDVESVVHSVEVEGEELDEETLNQVAGGVPFVQPVARITQFVAMEDHRLDPRIELSKGVRLPG